MTNGQFLEHGITFPLTEGQILKAMPCKMSNVARVAGPDIKFLHVKTQFLYN